MTLRERLQGLDGRSWLVETVNSTLSVEDLLRVPRDVPSCAVLIASADVVETIRSLVALDGRARRIGFCSPHIQDSHKRLIIEKGGFDVILGSGDAHIPTCATADELFRHLQSRQQRVVDAPPWDGATSWVMSTSGTTGLPKLVPHSLSSLTATTKTDVASMQHIRWGLLYDFTRFAGMQVLLQSLLSGAVLVVPPLDLPLHERIEFLAKRNVSHLSATPTLWRKILMVPGHQNVSIKVATLGGEIADQSILDALKASYPAARVIHIFASTESGVGFSVGDGFAGFPAEYLSDGSRGVELRVRNEVLEVRTKRVGQKYLGSDGVIADDEGWVVTGDKVRIAGNRVFFMGRVNGAINVGGNKVMPETVEQALLSHPSVVTARVYPRSSPIAGSLVVADVVLSPSVVDKLKLKRELREFLRLQLETYQIPAFLNVVDDMEVNASGKVSRVMS